MNIKKTTHSTHASKEIKCGYLCVVNMKCVYVINI